MKPKRVNFRKLAAAGIMGIAFGCSAQAALTTNFVGDASFDDTAVPGIGYAYFNGAPDSDWFSSGSWWYNSSYDSGRRPTPRTGNQALHGGASYAYQALTNVFEEGRTYTLSLWTQGDSDSSGDGSAGTDTIWLYIYDGTVGSTESNLTFVGLNQDGTFVDGTNSEDAGPFSGFNRSGGSEWAQVSLIHTVVAGAPEIGQPIGIGFYGRGDAAFDDVMLTTFEPDPGSPPAITSEPQNQDVIIGDPAGEATFSVAAIGDAPLVYQWYLDASPVPGGTNSSLAVTNAGAAEIGDYGVIIANAFGSVTSQTASLALITTDIDPAAQSVVFGDTATFSITLPGTDYGYQWTMDGGNIGGANGSELELVGARLSNTGEYAVVVTHNGAAATSGVATLEVTLPEVVPAAKAVLVTDTTSFSVPLTGAGITYQWKKGGVNEPGETNATLVLTGIALSDAGDYTVEAGLGGETHLLGTGALTVSAFPTQSYEIIVTGDSPIAYWRLGESAGATQAVDQAANTYHGHIRPSVTMGGDGALIGDADSCATFPAGPANGLIHVAEDFLSPSLGWEELNPDIFTVECWAKADGGSGTFRSPVTSRGFYDESDIEGWTLYATSDDIWQFRIGQGMLVSGSAWNIISGPTVVEGAWTHLVGTYDGTDMKFYVDGALWGVVSNADFTSNLDAPLFIGAGGTEDDAGDFHWDGDVDEVSLYGRALSAAEVLEHWAAAFQPGFPPSVTGQPQDVQRLAGEAAAAFGVAAHSTPVETYQWQYGGVDIPGATDQVLVVSDIEAADAGMYRVIVNNSTHSTTSNVAELEVCSGTCDIQVHNGGFDDATGVLADFWNDGGGSIRGGVEGGFGWTAGYYTGGFPTDNTFATTVNPGPVRQDLTGRTFADGLTYGRSFVEGVTYTLTVDLFSSDTYGASSGATINWRIALTADGETVAEDAWYSDEFETAGETVPPGRLISVTPDGGPGLTTATLVYTATAADAGKTLGVELGGDVTLGATTGDDYYGHMDSVQLTAETAAATATMTLQWVSGQMVLSWDDESGTLQEVEDLEGTWSDVTDATSPVIVIPTTPQNNWRLRE